MDTENVISYLKIFGLVVFDLFFLIMIFVGLYTFYTFFVIKKTIIQLSDEVKNLISDLKIESNGVAQSLKDKIETLNIGKIAFGSSLVGGLFMGVRSMFGKKKGNTSLISTILRIIK